MRDRGRVKIPTLRTKDLCHAATALAVLIIAGAVGACSLLVEKAERSPVPKAPVVNPTHVAAANATGLDRTVGVSVRLSGHRRAKPPQRPAQSQGRTEAVAQADQEAWLAPWSTNMEDRWPERERAS